MTFRWAPLFVITVLVADLYASVEISIPCPIDVAEAKYGIWKQPEHQAEITADRKYIYQIEDILRAQTESALNMAFGPAEPLNIKEYVLPGARHTEVGFSGINYKGGQKSYFLPIHNIGGFLVFPLGDQDFVSSVAIYLKIDDAFVPLQNASSYDRRRAWDVDRLKQLETVIKRKIQKTEQADAPNSHAFGTFVTDPAEPGSAPKASGSR